MKTLAKFRIGILLAVLAMLPLAARAQTAPATSPPCDSACAHPATMGGMSMGGMTTSGMDHMDMGMCMRMMAAGQARLDSLVTTMHSARGTAKTGAMERVIDEMLAQRKEMHEHMMHMMTMMNMHAMPDSGHR